jgi:hypothetical protein
MLISRSIAEGFNAIRWPTPVSASEAATALEAPVAVAVAQGAVAIWRVVPMAAFGGGAATSSLSVIPAIPLGFPKVLDDKKLMDDTIMVSVTVGVIELVECVVPFGVSLALHTSIGLAEVSTPENTNMPPTALPPWLSVGLAKVQV